MTEELWGGLGSWGRYCTVRVLGGSRGVAKEAVGKGWRELPGWLRKKMVRCQRLVPVPEKVEAEAREMGYEAPRRLPAVSVGGGGERRA